MKRRAKAHWNGTLQEGIGEISIQSTVLNETQYSFKTRFADGIVTNPEELIAAAHAGCFSMALSSTLAHHNITAGDIYTTVIVDLDMQTLSITGIHLQLIANIIEGFNEAHLSK
jgi:osmotically inducible protein OsmC